LRSASGGGPSSVVVGGPGGVVASLGLVPVSPPGLGAGSPLVSVGASACVASFGRPVAPFGTGVLGPASPLPPSDGAAPPPPAPTAVTRGGGGDGDALTISDDNRGRGGARREDDRGERRTRARGHQGQARQLTLDALGATQGTVAPERDGARSQVVALEMLLQRCHRMGLLAAAWVAVEDRVAGGPPNAPPSWRGKRPAT
jgi:hypothetical protein